MIVLLILFVLLWQQARDNPYLTDDLNSVDFKATFAAFCTIFGGLLSYVTQNDVITALIISCILGGNVLFLYIWIRRIIILKSNSLLKNKYLKYFYPFFEKLSLGLSIFSEIIKTRNFDLEFIETRYKWDTRASYKQSSFYRYAPVHSSSWDSDETNEDKLNFLLPYRRSYISYFFVA